MKKITRNPLLVLSQEARPVKINGFLSSKKDRAELSARLRDGRERIHLCKVCKDGFYHINTY